ncbi:DUF3429 domain-containing protein [Marinomonas pollencensis]|uniref:Uncharacterized protein DUF3429 n=1 Tax=Marinomonas pollencensis TaxID=491954 RepID=A0A3E0DSM3_9GAMM|nr:DUF3429 domain-containing protein [Marinomonas pollencensis]REG84951.1 uncharacterized protein DUF3429 [Marinomonas pollencensis]
MRSTSVFPLVLFGLFGVVPFAIWTLLAITGTSFMRHSGLELFAGYGAIMLSFFNGVVFGQVLENPQRTYSRRVMSFSHLISLLAWGTLLMGVPTLSVMVLLLGFISTFWLEIRCLKLLFAHSDGHSKTRYVLITIVCVLHILVLFPHY